MVQTIPAKTVTLQELTEKFNLQLVEDEQFFREWQDSLPEITAAEESRLDRVKASYSNLVAAPPMLENTVKMVVLSPLLDLAGFYLPPFRIKSEKSTEISLEDEGVIIRGQIDVLAAYEQFWVVVIESKRSAFSLEVGKPQLLAYMLSNPDHNGPTYGLLTNGNSFLFLKLLHSDPPQYGLSRLFYIYNPGNDLYHVLRILRGLSHASPM